MSAPECRIEVDAVMPHEAIDVVADDDGIRLIAGYDKQITLTLDYESARRIARDINAAWEKKFGD